MTPDARKTRTTVTRSEREELLGAMFVDAPELTFTPRGDPDARLVRLVELLAIQAAREFYDAEMKKRGAHGSR